MNTGESVFAPQIIGQQFLKSSTGILVLKSDSFTKTIHFENGFCTFATSNIYEDRMGERLIEWGFLSETQFAKASEVMHQNHWKLGKTLIHLAYLDEAQLARFIQRQVKEIIFSTFSCSSIEFRFDSCTLPEYEYKLHLEVPQLLIEGMRRISDTELLASLFPDQDLKLKLSIPSQTLFERVVLEPQEAYLISILENEPQTIRSLVSQGVVPPAVTYATLYAMLCVELLQTSRPQPAKVTPREIPLDSEMQKAMQFCYEIESKVAAINNNSSYYQLLEIEKGSSLPEIRKAYAELSNKFNPARQAELSRFNLDMKAHLERISTHLTRAVQTLLNPDSRRDYDACLTQSYQRNLTPLDPETLKLLTAPDESALQDLEEPQLERTMSRSEVSEFCSIIDDKLWLIRSDPTYYQILEVPNYARTEDIERAYTRLSHKFHLVKQMHLSAFGYDKRRELEQIGQSLCKAYNVLVNPQTKLEYDQRMSTNMRRTRDIPVLKAPSPAPAPPSINRVASQVVQPPLIAQPAQPLRAQPAPPLQAMAANKVNTPSLSTKSNPAPGKSRLFEAAEVYIKAIEAEDAGKHDEAAILMRRVVQLAPKDPHYWSHLGKILSQNPKNFREAESAIREAIRLDPKDPNYYAELGTLYRKCNNPQKAIEMFEKALEINSNHHYSKKALNELKEPEPKPKNGGFLSKFGL